MSYTTYRSYKYIYLAGIGGINVSAIAALWLHQGIKVSGYDLNDSEIIESLRAKGADISVGDIPDNLPEGVDLFVYSDAVPENHPLRVLARQKKVSSQSAFEFWGEWSRGKRVIAISGSNGKSTTTALLGWILTEAGIDPTVVAGTKVRGWNSNIRIGKSDWLVIEADEYHAHMQNIVPEIAVITNVSADHLDYYRDTADIVSHFNKWTNTIPAGGGLVLNRDDKESENLSVPSRLSTRFFGIKGESAIRAVGITICPGTEWEGKAGFNIIDDKDDWGYVRSKLPGMHNIQNALAAAAACDLAGVNRQAIIRGIETFPGAWRRFEMVGELNNALVISDYAHHPDGIKATLAAARAWYPHKRITALFQPHHHNRTNNLFGDFAASFDCADRVILTDVYDVAGREAAGEKNLTSGDLAKAIVKRLESPSENIYLKPSQVAYVPSKEEAANALRREVSSGEVVIVMGAGDIDGVARRLVDNRG